MDTKMYDLFLTKIRIYSPDGKLVESWDNRNYDPMADIRAIIAAMGIFQGYTPFGPHNPRPEDRVEIPERTIKLAKDAGGTHISKDGKIIYKKVFGIVQYADWDGQRFDSWWDTQSDTFPSEVVEIK